MAKSIPQKLESLANLAIIVVAVLLSFVLIRSGLINTQGILEAA